MINLQTNLIYSIMSEYFLSKLVEPIHDFELEWLLDPDFADDIFDIVFTLTNYIIRYFGIIFG